MQVVKKIGRYSICENRGALYLRWWNRFLKKTESQRLDAGNLLEAESLAKELIRVIAEPTEPIAATSGLDPTFGEVWLSYEQLKRSKLSPARFNLLKNRLDLYYRPFLWSSRMSEMGPALIEFVKFLRGHRYSRKRGNVKGGVGDTPLHPNTIQDIVQTAHACVDNAYSSGLSRYPAPRFPDIHGTTTPDERDPKGRYVSVEEIGALIDACSRPHILDLLLLEIGTGARISHIGNLKVDQVYLDLGVIDLLGAGVQTNKRKPIAPISGPMHGILDRLIGASKSGYLLEVGGKKAIQSRNYTQVIQRLVTRSGIDNSGPSKVNWYSIRRTLADRLDEWVSSAAISSVMGHFNISRQEREKILGSPMSMVYKTRKLGPILEVADALNEHWWPAIQPHTRIALTSTDAATKAQSADSLKHAEANEEKICVKSARFSLII